MKAFNRKIAVDFLIIEELKYNFWLIFGIKSNHIIIHVYINMTFIF